MHSFAAKISVESNAWLDRMIFLNSIHAENKERKRRSFYRAYEHVFQDYASRDQSLYQLTAQSLTNNSYWCYLPLANANHVTLEAFLMEKCSFYRLRRFNSYWQLSRNTRATDFRHVHSDSDTSFLTEGTRLATGSCHIVYQVFTHTYVFLRKTWVIQLIQCHLRNNVAYFTFTLCVYVFLMSTEA